MIPIKHIQQATADFHEMECPECNAPDEKICDEDCDTCQGTGECDGCMGEGDDDCPECEGSGTCNECQGNGFIYGSHECMECGLIFDKD